MNKKIILALIIYFFQIAFANASIFEGLDKLPVGAHEGQIIVGCFGAIGYPFGSLVSAENDFVKNDTYFFPDSDTTKEFLITHLAYDLGLFFEYMPIDYVGVKSKLKKVYIVQRTLFGTNFQNYSENLYSAYSFLIGPSIHFTNRKQWDVSLTPMVGYSIAKYKPIPIADNIKGYSGGGKKDANGIIYGAELNYAIFLNTGLYLSIGLDWNRYPISLSPGVKLVNPETSKVIDETSGNIQSISIIFSAGYAFDN